ncbi:SpoIIE family protein phosphatase [Rhodohalobacter mucosus]|uniref:PPM-type phosphatase domain-containing protein n=1 Tax=Rhodohalobacter mucosus TaxID=2079485 RepID=A0A316TSE9_9BACT|nr:SpoIIE family protein phosphatase [Rhodohalobacter mucosus]PWN06259.1 hypothetical protein DDZ15_10550 [Rhodohalobacter mucosus]
MATFSDSTKRDWGLVIAGFLGLGLFFWFYGIYHPLSVSENQLSETDAIQKSEVVFRSLGYTSDFEPKARFMANPRLLDSLQVRMELDEYGENNEMRRRLPAYFWESSFFVGEPQGDNPLLDLSATRVVQILLNEDGDFLGINNNTNVLPSAGFNSDLLEGILGTEISGSLPPDSLPVNRIQFRFDPDDEETETGPSSIDLSQINYLNRVAAEDIARYYLGLSTWEEQELIVSNVEAVNADGTGAALVTFVRDNEIPGYPTEVNLTVLATGQLISMGYTLLESPPTGIAQSELVNNIRIGAVLLGIFWILILLIIRFRMRLIDMKAAVLVAVLAGFTLPFIVLMQLLYQFLYNFGSFSLSYLVTVLTILGITAALTSVIYFMVTSIADSITREKWVDKLRTVDLIRIGHFASRPVGLALLRGTLYSFVLSGLWALMYALLPGYLTVEEAFYGSSTYLPGVVTTLGNLLWIFIICEAVFLIVISYLRSYKKSAVTVILAAGVIFALMNPLAVQVGPFSTEMLLLGLIGISAGLIYYYEDFLTVFVTLFFTTGFLYSPSGWLVDHSPDVTLIYIHMALIVLTLIAGIYSIRKGKLNSDIPEFIPEYIEELAQEERIKQELQIARKVQQSFLPVSTPDFRGLEIAAICKPAYETGGDYYDFIELDDDTLAVTIGDVSGKGIQAAFYMTFTKGVLHALCNDFYSTIDVLSKSNTLFRKNADKGTFISLIFGVVDLKNSLFRFSRAGHNPLLYYSIKEEKLHEYTPLGIGLGMADQEVFEKNTSEQSIKLEKGDVLIMFTDGVVEAVNNNDSFYGEARLQKLIRANCHLSPEKLLKVIVDDLERFSDGASQHDDMTMLIIRKQ